MLFRRGGRGAALAALSATALALLGGWAVARAGSDAKIEATAFSVDSTFGFESGAESAICPGHKRALGGGIVQSGFPEGAVQSSGPLDWTGRRAETRDGDKAKQWYASVTNYSSGVMDFKVFAICSADSTARLETQVFRTESNQTGHAVAKCAAGKRALGGGVISPDAPPNDPVVIASGPRDASGEFSAIDDGDKAKQWYGAAYNNNSGVDHSKFRVFVICAADSNATAQRTRFDVDSPGTDADYAECPAGRRAVGGGVIPSSRPVRRFYVRASGPLDSTSEMESTEDGDRATQWYAAVFNYPGGQTRSFDVLALCES